jgi:general L-amino acid transport system permease protein
MTSPVSGHGHQHAAVPLWRDIRIIRIAAQAIVLLLVAVFVAFLMRNLVTAMSERGLIFGFSFMSTTAGFEIAETPIPYQATDTYGRAFLVGLLNTIFVSVVGIILATILGLFVGVARLSSNWLVNRIAAGYVELMRNTPLLVQLFLIYAALLQLPAVADALSLPGPIFMSHRGLALPAPVAQATFFAWLGLLAVGFIAFVFLRVLGTRSEEAGRPIPFIGLISFVALIAIPVGGWFLVGAPPIAFDPPVRERFNFTGGMTLSPEFSALLAGLVLYTAAFIGEVIRGGIQAVGRGQSEAAFALGLREGQTLRLVVLPQALRVIIPPLTSQYLNLAKNSSLAIAIGYPDLFSVSRTMANQTGQPVSMIVLVMATYLSISLATSLLMNIYNRRIQIKER